MGYPLHLEKKDIVNLGSYYTDVNYIQIVWNFIKPYVTKSSVIFDPACGYGDFLSQKTTAKKIGNDIDELAINRAKARFKDVDFYCFNALENPNRKKFNIKNNDDLIIIGNPPYNDVTSQAKKNLKNINFKIDEDLKTRDIGISFLRMFDKLKANIVAVLHPLSYLIKKTNFNSLKNFRENYKLIDGIIISSREFNFTSQSSEFPIIIALYERKNGGMDFDYIKEFKFNTIDNKSFSLVDFDYIGNYVDKYPKKNSFIRDSDILFYTLRDINALKRNRTFIDKPINNAVKVDPKKIDYYIYIDVFKDFIDYIPYYLRNLDIIFDEKLFKTYKPYFISYFLQKNKNLANKFNFEEQKLKHEKKCENENYENKIKEKIKKCLKQTLKGHFYENLPS